jgi:actin-related protein 9
MCSYSFQRAVIYTLQEFPARVGLRRNAPEDTDNDTSYTSGIDTNDCLSPHNRVSSLPQHVYPAAKVNDYLVGTLLDEALAAGQDIAISWPFADGDIRDWTQAEAIWYVLKVMI